MLILIIGCGGIGSALFQDLVRTKHIRENKHWNIVLVDGDRVEQKNIGRQHFVLSQVGKYKAEALAETASVALNLKNVHYANKYIRCVQDLDNILDKHHYRELIIFGCLDNHSARLVIENFIKKFEYYHTPAFYIDCANGLNEGEVVSVYKYEKSLAGSFRSVYDPSVLTDKTDEKIIESEPLSCNNLVDEGNEQTIIANRKSAIIALEIFDNIIKKNIPIGIYRFKDLVVSRVNYKS